jgi:hypothetical protein
MRITKDSIKLVNEGYKDGIRETFLVVTNDGTRIYNPTFRKLPKCIQDFVNTHEKTLTNETENTSVYTYK